MTFAEAINKIVKGHHLRHTSWNGDNYIALGPDGYILWFTPKDECIGSYVPHEDDIDPVMGKWEIVE